MTNPLAPPPELVPQWRMDAWQARVETMGADVPTILLEIAQWGWDQREHEIQAAANAELEACIDWMSNARNHGLGWDLARTLSNKLRAARRPKPPSLKEQACAALDAYIYGNPDHGDKQNTYNTIRRALEALPDD